VDTIGHLLGDANRDLQESANSDRHPGLQDSAALVKAAKRINRSGHTRHPFGSHGPSSNGTFIANKALAGEAFVPTDASRMEMAGLVDRENAQKAIDRLFGARGAHGLFENDNFERYYRDVRMGTLHAVSTPDLVREEVGKHIFGIQLGTQPRWV